MNLIVFIAQKDGIKAQKNKTKDKSVGVNKTNHSKDSFNTTGATIHRSKKFVKTHPRQIL